MKVSAIDVATGTEICIQGPKNASEDILKANALKRLQYVLQKKNDNITKTNSSRTDKYF